MCQIEKGNSFPSAELLQKVVDILEIPIFQDAPYFKDPKDLPVIENIMQELKGCTSQNLSVVLDVLRSLNTNYSNSEATDS